MQVDKIFDQLLSTASCFLPPMKREQNIAIGVANLKEKVEVDALSPHLLAIRQINHATFNL